MFFKLFCAGLAATLSVFVWLLSFWSVSVAAVFNTTTASVKEATRVLGSHKGVSGFSEIHRDNERVFVDFQERRFVWEDGSFRKLRFPVDSSFVSLTENKGVTAEEAVALRNKYGTNALSLPVPSFRQLYREHALAPFFVLQIFFVLLWLMDEYWMYAVLTGGMLGLMEALTVWKRLKTIRFLRSMIQTSSLCSVSRGGKWTKLPSAELVPGDLFQVSAGIVPCDAVLVSGSCVVNESTLTGENVALLKDSVAQREGSDRLSLSRDRVHVLFGGTSVLQLSSAAPVRALAIRTGFASSQGKVRM
jgi:cation-transporting ATPase 13A1